MDDEENSDDEELGSLEHVEEKAQDMEGQDDIKEALKRLKIKFKLKGKHKNTLIRSGGAAELRALCAQMNVQYTEKERTMKLMAENPEIRNLLYQQKVI